MKLIITDDKNQILEDPYIIKFKNWSEERYYHEAPSDIKCEYVEGDVIMYCPMSTEHSKATGFLYFLLEGYCDANELGQVLQDPTVRLFPQINRQPDICFVPEDKAHLALGLPMKVVPSFIIEVSWSTQEIDLGEKMQDYQKAGVLEYWVIDIENQEVLIHLLEDEQYKISKQQSGALTSKEIKGFFIEIDWLWQNPLPSSLKCLKKILGNKEI
jgi:Uma2 family endonuclease